MFRHQTVFVCFLAGLAVAQTPKAVMGTVTAFQPEQASFVVKADAGGPVTVKMLAETVVERVAPGGKNLKNAKPMQATDIAIGDKVLVRWMPNGTDARRIVVMSATEISKHDEADRQDWVKRGVAGVVTAKNGNDFTLRTRALPGGAAAAPGTIVTISEKTVFRRYAPDSVKFVDAKMSSLSEVSVGDQLRARGEKAPDGTKVTAEEIVFGTFLTKAGPVTAVNAEAREVTIKDLVTNKPLLVKFGADSQIRKFPDMAGMFGGGVPGGGAPGGPPASAPKPAAPQQGRPGPAPAGGMAMRPGGGTPDLSQMLDRLPPGKLEDLKAGDTIIVSSTKGATGDQVTAITLIANAGRLVQMAQAMSAPRPAGAQGAAGPSMAGLSTGLDTLNMPGMIP